MDLEPIHEALLDGFTKDSLERLLKFHLNKSLPSIADTTADFERVAYQVIEDSRRNGWTGPLVAAMKLVNTGNEKVRGLGEYGGIPLNERGLAERVSVLAEQIYELRTTVLGIKGLDKTGVLAEVRSISQRVDNLALEVRRLDERLKKVNSTLPEGSDALMKRVWWAILAGTAISTAISIFSLFGGG